MGSEFEYDALFTLEELVSGGATVEKDVAVVPDVDVVAIPVVDLSEPVTNGTKMMLVPYPTGYDKEVFRRVLSGAYQDYLSFGEISPGRVASLVGVPLATCQGLLSTEELARALSLRGVSTSGYLTPQQDAALVILSDIGTKKNFAGRLKDAGITYPIFQAWMQQPVFARRWQEISEKITADSGLALVELGRKVGEGDMQAIRLQLEVNRRHDPVANQMLDATVLISKIVDVLAKKLRNHPDVFQETVAELKAVADAIETKQAPTLNF